VVHIIFYSHIMQIVFYTVNYFNDIDITLYKIQRQIQETYKSLRNNPTPRKSEIVSVNSTIHEETRSP